MHIDGLWTIRVGLFGARDRETRGGVVALQGNRIIGGDSNLAYMGHCRASGTELAGHLHLIRHGDPDFVTIFGRNDAEYEVDFVAERMGEGYYEGRLLVYPAWQGRLVLRRLSDLPVEASYDPRPYPAAQKVAANASIVGRRGAMDSTIRRASAVGYARN